MPRPAPLPPSLSGQPFSVTAATTLGVPRGRLRSSDLSSPFHGARMPRPDGPLSYAYELRALAYATLMSPLQFFSHTTAAVLLGFRMPDRFAEIALHVTSAAPLRAPRSLGIIGHQSSGGIRPITLPGGVRVTNLIDTWCALGTVLSLDDLVIATDGLLARKNPLSTVDQLRTAASACVRGRAALLRALGLARSGTDSARETMLRLMIMRGGFPEPEVNGIISAGALSGWTSSFSRGRSTSSADSARR